METNSYGLSSELFSLLRNGLERNSKNLLLFLFHGTEFRVVFSSAEVFRREFRECTFIVVPQNGIPSCFFSAEGFGREFQDCFYFCSTERNSELFSLPQKGLELNSENFLFRRTAGIRSEITIDSLYSVFHGIIFLSEIPNPMSCPSIEHSKNVDTCLAWSIDHRLSCSAP